MSLNIGQQMQHLYSQYGEMPGISIELHNELLAIRVENKLASATVFLQGAQLSHFQKHGEAAIVWCSPQTEYCDGQPLAGGIPLCWPWLGELRNNPAAVQQAVDSTNPDIHGIVHRSLWTIANIFCLTDSHTRLTLQLSLTEEDEPLWLYAIDLQLTIDITDSLRLQWQISNPGPKSMVFAQALHSYFAVGDINQVTLNGLEELEYIDCVENWNRKTQQGAIAVNGEIDRIYQLPPPTLSLVDKAWRRIITVTSEGNNSIVVWNPGREKSRNLARFSDTAYKEMLCIETANVAENCVTLGAGEQHFLCLTIASQPLSS